MYITGKDCGFYLCKIIVIILTWTTSRFSVIMNPLLLRHPIVQIMIIFIIKRRSCLLPDRRMFTSVLCRQSSTSSTQIWTCRKVLRWKRQMKGKGIKIIKELRDAVRGDSKRKIDGIGNSSYIQGCCFFTPKCQITVEWKWKLIYNWL